MFWMDFHLKTLCKWLAKEIKKQMRKNFVSVTIVCVCVCFEV